MHKPNANQPIDANAPVSAPYSQSEQASGTLLCCSDAGCLWLAMRIFIAIWAVMVTVHNVFFHFFDDNLENFHAYFANWLLVLQSIYFICSAILTYKIRKHKEAQISKLYKFTKWLLIITLPCSFIVSVVYWPTLFSTQLFDIDSVSADVLRLIYYFNSHGVIFILQLADFLASKYWYAIDFMCCCGCMSLVFMTAILIAWTWVFDTDETQQLYPMFDWTADSVPSAAMTLSSCVGMVVIVLCCFGCLLYTKKRIIGCCAADTTNQKQEERNPNDIENPEEADRFVCDYEQESQQQTSVVLICNDLKVRKRQSTDSQKAADDELEELNAMSDSSDEFEVEDSKEEIVFVVNSHNQVTAGGQEEEFVVHGVDEEYVETAGLEAVQEDEVEEDVLEGDEWKFDGEYEIEELMNMGLPPQPSLNDVSLQPLVNGVDESYSDSDSDTPFEGMIVRTTMGNAHVQNESDAPVLPPPPPPIAVTKGNDEIGGPPPPPPNMILRRSLSPDHQF